MPESDLKLALQPAQVDLAAFPEGRKVDQRALDALDDEARLLDQPDLLLYLVRRAEERIDELRFGLGSQEVSGSC